MYNYLYPFKSKWASIRILNKKKNRKKPLGKFVTKKEKMKIKYWVLLVTAIGIAIGIGIGFGIGIQKGSFFY